MSKTVIKPLKNASNEVSGGITLIAADGKKMKIPADKTIYLCRCGHSKNKPYCDGTHKKIGFKAPGV